jgi:membrane protein required for beta-lactamase induction
VPALPIEWLVGPVAALALALLIGRELWRSHREMDKREQDRADALDARLDRIADALAEGLKKADPK